MYAKGKTERNMLKLSVRKGNSGQRDNTYKPSQEEDDNSQK
jgi:hypothetical protein